MLKKEKLNTVNILIKENVKNKKIKQLEQNQKP